MATDNNQVVSDETHRLDRLTPEQLSPLMTIVSIIVTANIFALDTFSDGKLPFVPSIPTSLLFVSTFLSILVLVAILLTLSLSYRVELGMMSKEDFNSIVTNYFDYVISGLVLSLMSLSFGIMIARM